MLKAVLNQHLRPVNEARRKGLKRIKHEARRENQRPAVLDVLRAFIEPVLHLKGEGRSDSDFGALIGRAFVDPDETVQKIFLDLVKPVSALMLDLLGRALPDLPKETLIWRFQFLIGAMATAMCMYDNPKFESPRLTETKLDWLIESLLSFVDAGMEAPLSRKRFCSPKESGGNKKRGK